MDDFKCQYSDLELDSLVSRDINIHHRGTVATVTLARPFVSSSLQITNRSFRYASPHLWNQLPSPFRQPHSFHSPPGSPHPAHIT